MKTDRTFFIYWLMVIAMGFVGRPTNHFLLAQDSSTAQVPSNWQENPTARFWLSPSVDFPRKTWETRASELINANVLDMDERDIMCVTKETPNPSKYASSQLHAIDTVWGNPTANLAHAAFVRGEFAVAIENSKKAIAEGKIPRWQQKILAAEITDCLMNLGQTTAACRVFISLCKESPAPMLYASAPLNWTSQRGNTQLVEQAQEWMRSDRTPIEQLIGASWLLNGNDATAALTLMEQLRRSKSTVISQLATSQVWRRELPNQVAERYSQWSEYRDRMLLPLQLGPTIAIADKLERAGRKEEALQEWLRILALFPKQRLEVRQARDAAIELLKQLGRVDEANRLNE